MSSLPGNDVPGPNAAAQQSGSIIKRIARIFLSPVIGRLNARFNAIWASLDGVAENFRGVNDNFATLGDHIKGIDDKVGDVERRRADFTEEMVDRVNCVTRVTNERLDRIEGRNEELLYKYRSLVNMINVSGAGHSKTDAGAIDYLDFENRFRGGEEEIKKRQSIYLSIFSELGPDDLIVDLGCGRGEFLELLKESNLKGHGIDQEQGMVELCEEKGLSAEDIDMFRYLDRADEDSLGAVVALQVIEHISTYDLQELVRLTYSRLKKGGYVLFETPNPTNLSIFSGAFYVDPSHNKPVHPELAKFILESVGFAQVDVWYVNQPDEEKMLFSDFDKRGRNEKLSKNFELLNSILFSAADYCIIARKV